MHNHLHMRSTIKIILGFTVICAILCAITFVIIGVTCFIHPQQYLNILTKSDPSFTLDRLHLIGSILLILTLYAFLSIFIDNHAIKKMNEAYKKSELIPSIIFLLISLNIIPALLIIFTPSKRLISTHPYFE